MGGKPEHADNPEKNSRSRRKPTTNRRYERPRVRESNPDHCGGRLSTARPVLIQIRARFVNCVSSVARDLLDPSAAMQK